MGGSDVARDDISENKVGCRQNKMNTSVERHCRLLPKPEPRKPYVKVFRRAAEWRTFPVQVAVRFMTLFSGLVLKASRVGRKEDSSSQRLDSRSGLSLQLEIMFMTSVTLFSKKSGTFPQLKHLMQLYVAICFSIYSCMRIVRTELAVSVSVRNILLPSTGVYRITETRQSRCEMSGFCGGPCSEDSLLL